MIQDTSGNIIKETSFIVVVVVVVVVVVFLSSPEYSKALSQSRPGSQFFILDAKLPVPLHSWISPFPGNKTQREDVTVHNDDEDEDTVDYENAVDSSASVRHQ
ncbi:hypothetical protein Q8A73_018183 [Channa argus]|nr:hypothetical protein Q8A73_018183 [Channa argus]